MFKISRFCSLLITKQLHEVKYVTQTNIVLQHKWKHFNFVRNCSQNTNSETIGDVDMDAITEGDTDLQHKLKILILETDMLRQEGKLVPSVDFLKTSHWKELLQLPSISGRRKYLEFLFKTEIKKKNAIEKRRAKGREMNKEEKPEPEEGKMQYDLMHNNILLRIYDTTINQLYNNRLIQAMQFSQKLVIDCGFNDAMTKRENINCAKQLMLTFAENRAHDEPFDLHYCNCDKQSVLMDYLQRHIPNMYEDYFPINIHEENYLDLFRKEQLVYLTPHCREELTEYSHDDVYIIGAIVDKINCDPLSLAKAKQQGLRMAKLPIDLYLQWGSGSGKSLTLNQVLAIMLDARHTGDWKHALRHVPQRKLIDHSQNQLNTYKKNYSQRSVFQDNPKRLSWKPRNKEEYEERLVHLKKIMSE